MSGRSQWGSMNERGHRLRWLPLMSNVIRQANLPYSAEKVQKECLNSGGSLVGSERQNLRQCP